MTTTVDGIRQATVRIPRKGGIISRTVHFAPSTQYSLLNTFTPSRADIFPTIKTAGTTKLEKIAGKIDRCRLSFTALWDRNAVSPHVQAMGVPKSSNR